jgi:hypothetical protein
MKAKKIRKLRYRGFTKPSKEVGISAAREAINLQPELNSSELESAKDRVLQLVEVIGDSTKTVLDSALEAGEWLIKIKASVPHGRFLPFVATLLISADTAQRWMALWRNRRALKHRTVRHLTEGYRFVDGSKSERKSKPFEHILDRLKKDFNIADASAKKQFLWWLEEKYKGHVVIDVDFQEISKLAGKDTKEDQPL